MSSSIIDIHAQQLKKPTHAVIQLSDVFHDTDTDIDAEITARLRNIGTISDLTFGIGKNPQLSAYILNLISDLIAEQRRIIENITHTEHPDILQRKEILDNTSLLAIANCAPRNNDTTHNGKNGKDFHLAITDDGLEIYTVPNDWLCDLEARNKVLALYKIPNEKIPFFDGSKEQFRSSIITWARTCPEILEPVFQYASVEELSDAKKNNKHPEYLSLQKNIEVAYIDKFGNMRISVPDIRNLHSILKQDSVSIAIGSEIHIANVVRSLRDIPEGELGIYHNISDHNGHNFGYYEIVKKMANPNTLGSSARDLFGGREVLHKEVILQ